MLHPQAFSYYRRLGAVARYVEEHGSEPISVRDVARVAGLEAKYFSAFFRAKVGVRFTEWLRAVRVERAARLMEASDASITRLAYEVGFGELRTFQRAFKRLVGTTPRAYRARLRPESRTPSSEYHEARRVSHEQHRVPQAGRPHVIIPPTARSGGRSAPGLTP